MSFDAEIREAVLSAAAYRSALKYPLTTDAAVGYYLTQLMRCVGDGYACAVFLDGEKRHIATVTLKRGGRSIDEPLLEFLERECNERKAAYFAVAHCHSDDELKSSRADRASTERIRIRFEDAQSKFIDHFIISGNGWSTVLGEKYSKGYADTKETSECLK